jgi:hypothetical protein
VNNSRLSTIPLFFGATPREGRGGYIFLEPSAVVPGTISGDSITKSKKMVTESVFFLAQGAKLFFLMKTGSTGYFGRDHRGFNREPGEYDFHSRSGVKRLVMGHFRRKGFKVHGGKPFIGFIQAGYKILIGFSGGLLNDSGGPAVVE